MSVPNRTCLYVYLLPFDLEKRASKVCVIQLEFTTSPLDGTKSAPFTLQTSKIRNVDLVEMTRFILLYLLDQ